MNKTYLGRLGSVILVIHGAAACEASGTGAPDASGTGADADGGSGSGAGAASGSGAGSASGSGSGSGSGASTGSGAGSGAGGDVVCTNPTLDPSATPPCGLSADEVPMFVVLTFDDNDRIAETMDFALDSVANHTHVDGTPVHLSFNVIGRALELGSWEPAAALGSIYKRAKDAGHEIGNHSYDHLQDEDYNAIPGNQLTEAEWRSQIVDSDGFIVSKCSLTDGDVVGWRTPRIEYTTAMFDALAKVEKYLYDTSLTETAGSDGGTDVTWPYSLDNGQSSTTANINPFGVVVGSYPGLWELPLSSLKRENAGDFIAVDYNAFHTGEGNMSGPEFRELLLKNLNLRLKGNRAPLVIAGHTGLFHEDFDSQPYWQTETTYTERREAYDGFVTEAVKIPEVRFVTQREMIEWMKAPTRL